MTLLADRNRVYLVAITTFPPDSHIKALAAPRPFGLKLAIAQPDKLGWWRSARSVEIFAEPKALAAVRILLTSD